MTADDRRQKFKSRFIAENHYDAGEREVLQDAALHVMCEQLQKIHQQAEIAGLFIGDRELLDCVHCGLQEDVLIDGRLVTYQADAADAADPGLRFAAADDGNFVCPQCGAVIAGDFFV